VLQPYKLVKDHRTGVEVGNVDEVLEGELDVFIWAYLRSKNNVKEFTKDIAGIFIGSLIYAIAVDIFIQPNHIAPGGFIGICYYFEPLF